MARVRADVGKHVKDIAERYLLPGETQDIALMFVPSESIYSDLVEHFDDVVQKAHRGRVVIVSPSLMMMAIQVTQAILRDARMRDQAHAIHAEVGKLLNDVRLLAERTAKLEGHFRQAQEDVGLIATSAEKVTRRAARIDAMEFSREDEAAKDRDAAEFAAGEGRGVGSVPPDGHSDGFRVIGAPLALTPTPLPQAGEGLCGANPSPACGRRWPAPAGRMRGRPIAICPNRTTRPSSATAASPPALRGARRSAGRTASPPARAPRAARARSARRSLRTK